LAIPYPGYLRRVAERTAVMWLLVRVFLALALWLSGLEFTETILAPTLGIPALLVWLDRRSGDELILQANLGASELWLTGGSLALVLLLDLLAHLLLTS